MSGILPQCVWTWSWIKLFARMIRVRLSLSDFRGLLAKSGDWQTPRKIL